MMQATLALVAAYWACRVVASGDWRWIVGALLILAPWP